MTNNITILAAHPFCGQRYIPGDKSISQRAIIFAALAQGETRLSHFLKSEDCLHTLEVLKALGLSFIWDTQGDLVIQGLGLKGFKAPSEPLYFGNSGTGLRLMAGVLAGQPFDSVLTGDASLCKRPMQRIIDPLKQMGAQITGFVPPLKITGKQNLIGIDYHLTVASAQVKSCILLAGQFAQGVTRVYETQATRDHTERLLEIFNVNGLLEARDLIIPGDMSSAAFFIVAALLIPGSHLVLKSVGVNPTRLGVIHILKLMGANIELVNQTDDWEPTADIIVQYSVLRGITIPLNEVVSAIDEFPILFIAAAFAQGRTILRGAGELRVKESDRLSKMAQNLQQLGVQLQEYADGMCIEGLTDININKNIIINTAGDHRIAMAFCIAGCVLKNKGYKGTFIVQDTDCINSSFPNFIELMSSVSVYFF